MTLTLGDRYRLEEPIGHGGMASVWRAMDMVLGRHVAVKRLHSGLLEDPGQAERFRREAQVVARLTHPGLVQLLDRGEDDGGPYLVFELVDGEDLATRIARGGRLAPADAASLCAQVARGLAHAHERGVIHRDVSARNILLTPDGHAKIADFGVARAEEAASGLTRTGSMIGTSGYLAPEQAQGFDVDARTDVYALGVVLYECLTGELPFTGEGALAVAIQHLSEPVPDPRQIAVDVPAPLAEAVLTATAKDPDARFPSADGFAEILEAAALGRDPSTLTFPVAEPETGRIVRPRRVRGVLVAAAAMGLVALAAAGTRVAGLWGGGGADGEPAPLTALPFREVVSFDPEGNNQTEQPDEVPFAWDDDESTLWHTENYHDTGDFSRRQDKSGVGLKMTLEAPGVARELRIVTPSVGARFEVRSGETGEPLGTATVRGGFQRVPLRSAEAGTEFILWFTSLPAEGLVGYRAAVGEVELWGTANDSS